MTNGILPQRYSRWAWLEWIEELRTVRRRILWLALHGNVTTRQLFEEGIGPVRIVLVISRLITDGLLDVDSRRAYRLTPTGELRAWLIEHGDIED